ncbi:hypothetical protein [Psychrobacter sp. B38]|uniref:hypothetical protein n=1 Tax=Psychrobacter sp. B38 TaxID=3143538 RepID=UPI003211C5CA
MNNNGNIVQSNIKKALREWDSFFDALACEGTASKKNGFQSHSIVSSIHSFRINYGIDIYN